MTENGSGNDSHPPNGNYNHHQRLYHWVYVFGVTVLTAGVDFLFLWPESHLGALLALAAWFALIAVYELTAFGVRARLVATAVVVLFVGAIVVFWIAGPVASPSGRLSLTTVEFSGNASLHAGPLYIAVEIINSGTADAVVSDVKATPVLVTGDGQLPDVPFYPPATRTIKGQHVIPGVPLHAVAPTTMSLTQEQVDAIEAGTSRLYFYGDFKYGTDKEYSFISVYDPRFKIFTRDDDQYPTYSKDD